jgi:hypothetical protein
MVGLPVRGRGVAQSFAARYLVACGYGKSADGAVGSVS